MRNILVEKMPEPIIDVFLSSFNRINQNTVDSNTIGKKIARFLLLNPTFGIMKFIKENDQKEMVMKIYRNILKEYYHDKNILSHETRLLYNKACSHARIISYSLCHAQRCRDQETISFIKEEHIIAEKLVFALYAAHYINQCNINNAILNLMRAHIFIRKNSYFILVLAKRLIFLLNTCNVRKDIL